MGGRKRRLSNSENKEVFMGVLIQCYYLFHGKQYCFLDLDISSAAVLLEQGHVVHGGRWYWAA